MSKKKWRNVGTNLRFILREFPKSALLIYLAGILLGAALTIAVESLLLEYLITEERNA